jgi:hypothetical protein
VYCHLVGIVPKIYPLRVILSERKRIGIEE